MTLRESIDAYMVTKRERTARRLREGIPAEQILIEARRWLLSGVDAWFEPSIKRTWFGGHVRRECRRAYLAFESWVNDGGGQ